MLISNNLTGTGSLTGGLGWHQGRENSCKNKTWLEYKKQDRPVGAKLTVSHFMFLLPGCEHLEILELWLLPYKTWII